MSFMNSPHSRIENDILKGEDVACPNDYRSFGKFILDSWERDSDFVGQIDAVTGEEYTYGKMRELSVRCALWMRSQGLLPGEVVAICSNDHLDFAIPCYATMYLGAVFTLWDEVSDADAFLHKMNVAKPKIVFADRVRAVLISKVAKEAKLELQIIVFGLPKGVAHSHRALMIMMQKQEVGMAGKVCFIVTATHWAPMIGAMFMTMFSKIPRMILPPFEANLLCALIEKHKANYVQVTPWNVNRLVKCDGVSRYDLSSLRTIMHVGESGGTLALRSTNFQPGSCGHIVANTQLKVIDPDTGRTLGANQKGEILAKSDSMMSFYWNNPDATAEAIDKEGWLHSGDLGYYDDDGEIFVTDRLKDIIRLENIDLCPSRIENVILSFPGVEEVAVVGKPRDQDEDILIAFVVRAEDSSETSKQVTEIEIMNLVAAEFPERQQLRAGVRFLDRLPRTPTNKIRRNVLRDLAKST